MARPAPPHGLGREAVDPNRDDVLVVRAVEDAELAARRQRRVHTPEVVVRQLGRRGHLERGCAAAQRVQAPEDRANDAVLARRVDSLEHEEKALGLFGVEPLLHDVESFVQVGEQPFAAALVEPEGRVRAALANLRRRSGLHE